MSDRPSIYLAHWFARCAKMAYLPKGSNLHVWKECLDLDGVEQFSDRETGADVTIGWNSQRIVVAFRGTKGGKDALQDMKVWRVAREWGFVHRGCLAQWEAVAESVKQCVKNLRKEEPRPVYFVGHSLGGGVAQVAALDAMFQDSIHAAGVYTFGGLRVFDWKTARAYDLRLSGVTHRLVLNNDIVPRVPPAHWGYKHTAGLRYLDRNGKLQSYGFWGRLRDRFLGRVKAFGWRGLDGLNDHAINRYITAVSDQSHGD